MSILALTSDTLIGTAAAGNIEYSSPIFTGTPLGTQRGIVPTQQYYRLDTAYAGANVSTVQNIFNVGCTLSASTVYEFEVSFALIKSAGTTSHTMAFGFGGTATINNAFVSAYWNAQASTTLGVGANPATYFSNSVSVTVQTGAITTASEYFAGTFRGTVSVNAGGTFIPQYQLSAAPGGAYTTQIGSYIKINPLSASGAATNVGTWA